MMLPRQFSTTIFSATQRSNISCYIVSTATLCEHCNAGCVVAKIVAANRPVYHQWFYLSEKINTKKVREYT